MAKLLILIDFLERVGCQGYIFIMSLFPLYPFLKRRYSYIDLDLSNCTFKGKSLSPY